MKNLKIHSVRHFLEAAIALELAHALIREGYRISVNDGEEFVLNDSTNVEEVLLAMFSTDQEYWYVSTEVNSYDMFIRFIYGNDGYDVVSDYSIGIERIVDPILDRWNGDSEITGPNAYEYLLQLLHADLERNKK